MLANGIATFSSACKATAAQLRRKTSNADMGQDTHSGRQAAFSHPAELTWTACRPCDSAVPELAKAIPCTSSLCCTWRCNERRRSSSEHGTRALSPPKASSGASSLVAPAPKPWPSHAARSLAAGQVGSKRRRRRKPSSGEPAKHSDILSLIHI